MEQWKDIKGYEGLYQVSNFGNVKSCGFDKWHKGKVIKPICKPNGYLQIFLYKNRNKKGFLIHRLVAAAFLPNPENLPQVNHKDENKTNNYVENLEWCTSIYNINYGNHNEKVASSHSKKVLCVETGIIYKSTRHIEKTLGFDHANISSCCRGLYNQAYGFHWQYI